MAIEFKTLKRGDPIPAEYINELVRLARRRVTGPGVYEDPSGWHISIAQNDVGVLQNAKTQEAAGANNYISVKLLGSDGSEVGDAFNAYAKFQDAATALNQCLPDVQSGKPVTVYKGQDGVWYLNLTFTKFTECT